ncbi:ATPase [Sorangium cellulosum]|uniref:ATPase n=1 Tax=Sorangium cellulosum TaxID=56 RepID=A0A150SDP7_SORCE|nr:ATPase [Sorangium cellulosum]KYF92090.1 ATPase [Sorangium cellulosum]
MASDARARAASPDGWSEHDERWLAALLALLRERLRRFAAPEAERESLEELERAVEAAHAALAAPSALDHVAAAFELTSFERDLILLCAGVALDAEIASLCAAAQRGLSGVHPTFNFALTFLEGAHWSAIAPAAPLRRFHLIEIGSGDMLAASPLILSERVLHHLVGIEQIDERLWGVVEPCEPPERLPAFLQEPASTIAGILPSAQEPAGSSVIHIAGDDSVGKRAVAAAACDTLGLRLCLLRAADIPASAAEREGLLRLWDREALLSSSALLLECDDLDGAAPWRAVSSFAERTVGRLLIASRSPVRLERRAAVRVEVPKASPQEQRAIWRDALGPAAERLGAHLDAVVSNFNLGAAAIESAAGEALAVADVAESDALAAQIWGICRARARPRLDDLAQRIKPSVGWADLVLPQGQRDCLRDILAQARQRYRVYETWGFGQRAARGLGVSALFWGPSGTGKTMAAEVLASELGLDLYVVDLSQMVSKYIGETEKNLRRVFDAADEGGTILLFDEADALFGKRSEVKDSHDRYANIEVSYLLQRMEAYRGLAILTTNMKGALDAAFLRRLRFVVPFTFPDAATRAEIWRRVFAPGVPTEGLDADRLARLAVAGGSIRNIALNAAFLAADEARPVRMAHLLRAAKAECYKLDRPLTDAELGGWV